MQQNTQTVQSVPNVHVCSLIAKTQQLILSQAWLATRQPD